MSRSSSRLVTLPSHGLLLVAALLALPACTEDPAPPSTRPAFGDDAPDVTAVDGMLVFADEKAFLEVTAALQAMERADADAWEADLGFESQRRIFDRVVDAEYQHLMAPYEDLSDAELADLEPPVGHSDAYVTYLDRGVIVETAPDADGQSTWTYALADASFASVVNEAGFFAVGDVVHQITSTQHQRRAGGADPDRVGGPTSAAIGAPFSLGTGWVTAGNRRGLLHVSMTPTDLNPAPTTSIQVRYAVNLQSQKKNFWGNWVYPSCPNAVTIGGSWTAVLRYIWVPQLSFSHQDSFARSYTYPNPSCVNNLTVSLQPTTGASIGSWGSVIFTAPANRAFSDFRIMPGAWSATVPGGISLTVTH
jgi:hypothetical protein